RNRCTANKKYCIAVGRTGRPADRWERESCQPVCRRPCRYRIARRRSIGRAPPCLRPAGARRADLRRIRFSGPARSAADRPFFAGMKARKEKARADASVAIFLSFVSSPSRLDLVGAERAKLAEKLARALGIELWIAGFDAEKETIAARQLEALDVENRMIGHRQA